MRIQIAPFLSLIMVTVLLSTGSVKAENDLNVNIISEFTYDQQDRNEWGPGPGGEEIRAEWGEPMLFRALPLSEIKRSVLYVWNITNIYSGRSTFYQGREIEVKFYPSNRRMDIIQTEKFLINLTVWYVRSNEYAARVVTQMWVWSDADDDNDGLPDCRERYYWDGDIIHHHPDYDEDGDGYTNMQEIGFNIPLAYSERKIPYVPPIGHFDPTDPNSPPTLDGPPGPFNGSDPDGPVMPIWAMYTLVGGIASIGVLVILMDVIYIKFFYLVPSKKKEDSLLEKSGKDRPLPLFKMLQNGSVG